MSSLQGTDEFRTRFAMPPAPDLPNRSSRHGGYSRQNQADVARIFPSNSCSERPSFPAHREGTARPIPTFKHTSRTEEQMARPAWKRPGWPIGKTGARKANPACKRRSREPWTAAELLKQLAKGNTPTGVISLKLQRGAGGDPQQGPTRGHLAAARQSFAV